MVFLLRRRCCDLAGVAALLLPDELVRGARPDHDGDGGAAEGHGGDPHCLLSWRICCFRPLLGSHSSAAQKRQSSEYS